MKMWTFLELFFSWIHHEDQYKLQKAVRVKTIDSKDNSSDVVLEKDIDYF